MYHIFSSGNGLQAIRCRLRYGTTDLERGKERKISAEEQKEKAITGSDF